MDIIPDDILFDVILSYIHPRDLSMYREVCIRWNILIEPCITKDVIDRYLRAIEILPIPINKKLRNDLSYINLHGFNGTDSYIYHEHGILMPYLDAEETWPEHLEHIHADEDETWLIRHILLRYISDTHVIPMIQDKVYLDWYVKITMGIRDMCLRLPPNIREQVKDLYGISTLDILLYERRQKRLENPFNLPNTEITYDFHTCELQEGDYLVYVGSTTEGLCDEYLHLCAEPDIISEDGVKWEYDEDMLGTYVYRYTNIDDMGSLFSPLSCGGHYNYVYVGQIKDGKILDVTKEHWDQ